MGEVEQQTIGTKKLVHANVDREYVLKDTIKVIKLRNIYWGHKRIIDLYSVKNNFVFI